MLIFAASALVSWVEPTENTDGSAYTDPSHYEIHHGCQSPGVYDTVIPNVPLGTSYNVTGLPDVGTCYFAMRSVNQSSVVSAFTPEVSHLMGTLPLPGPIENLNVTWQESPQGAWTLVSSGTISGSSGTASTGDLGADPDSNLVIAYVNQNNSGAFVADDAGWNSPAAEVPAGASAYHGAYWRVGGAETQYTWTLSGSTQWRIVYYIFSFTGSLVMDSFNVHIQGATETNLLAGAADGQAMNGLSVIFSGKDWRGSTEPYTLADQGYIGVEGDVVDQIAAGAYRIFDTPETFSGDITIQTADGDDSLADRPFSIHMMFTQ